jgi:transcription antitermination factor NusG
MKTTNDLTSNSRQPGYFAVKVRSRGELNVSRALRQKGFEVLAPTRTIAPSRPHGTRTTDTALFPGYVFVRLDLREMLALVTTDGVSYIVRNGKSLAPLPLEEELTVQSLCEGTTPCEPWNQFVAGQRVSIESGPLKGRRGTLMRIGDKDRLIISLNSIFSSVSVDSRDTIVRACTD